MAKIEAEPALQEWIRGPAVVLEPADGNVPVFRRGKGVLEALQLIVHTLL